MVVLVMFGVSLGTRQGALSVVATVLYGVLWPWGLSLKGRTGSLQWTRRARTVALVGALCSALLATLGLAMHAALVAEALAVWLVPVTLALAALVATPWESYLAGKFVTQASLRLRRVAPTVVAITGSYGKTSTKNHLADLLRGDGGVVATPKSFNNRAGLSRAINENLADGTRVFVAEMGTYGPGEIHDLCQWCTPDVAVITAIGPVHLERMKSLDVI
jgi:UDP-N-acetylmuramoyl-tripeptide--D-alanyl-D-alanine ligase